MRKIRKCRDVVKRSFGELRGEVHEKFKAMGDTEAQRPEPIGAQQSEAEGRKCVNPIWFENAILKYAEYLNRGIKNARIRHYADMTLSEWAECVEKGAWIPRIGKVSEGEFKL